MNDELLSVTLTDGVKRRSDIEGKDNSSEDKSNYKVVKIGDIAYNSMRMWQGASGVSKYDGIVSPAYTVLKPIADINIKYFASYFKTANLINLFRRNSQGMTSDTWNLKYPQIAPIKISIPNKNEQNKVAGFLCIIDERIEKQQRLVNALKSYKRGLLFSIFKHDNPFGITMSMTPMRTLLEESHVRETQGLRVCSVAVEKGVVDQVEHLGRSFAASDTSKYGRVEPNYVVYTKSPTGDFPYGIVKQNRLNETVAVSPLYGVYKPRSSEDGTLLHYYFEQHENANNYIRSLAQKGAKNTINITTDKFLDKDILYPANFSDVKTLVHTLDSLKLCIETQSCLLEELMLERKTLLSLMFI